jgi:hypothetical protein
MMLAFTPDFSLLRFVFTFEIRVDKRALTPGHDIHLVPFVRSLRVSVLRCVQLGFERTV